MFTKWEANLPKHLQDEKEKSRTHRHWSQKKTTTQQHNMDSYFASSSAGRDCWQNPFGAYSARPDPYDHIDDFFNAKRMPSLDPRPRDTYPMPGAHRDSHVSFEQASSNLYEALETASKGCQNLESSFHDCTQRLTPWLPSRHLDSLWAIFMEWNGAPVERTANADQHSSKPLTSDLPSATNVTTYPDIQRHLTNALSAVRVSAPPAKLGPGSESAAAPSWQILRTTTRKLSISFEAIEELMGMVRVRRDCMPSLVHEILAAMQLLESIRPLWDMLSPSPPQPPPRTGLASSATSTPRSFDPKAP